MLKKNQENNENSVKNYTLHVPVMLIMYCINYILDK
jgi:hypothetical protein